MASRTGESVRRQPGLETRPTLLPTASPARPGPKTVTGRARALANLKRGGQPGRKPGVPNAATMEIRALAGRLLVEDEEWIESARRRMIAGEAPHLEIFFLSHRFGRPKDHDQPPDRPPILFLSAYGPPGSYDPLAREGRADTQPIRRANSVAAGMPPALPREATSAKGDSGDDHRPGDDGEQELVVVRA
jgi:hypothetical protein